MLITDFTEKQLRHMRCMYFEMVTMLDELVGRVLQTLDDLGMADNTIIVFTSDHGEMLGDHGRVAKICFYDQALRVPLIIRHPAGMKKGQVRDALSEQTDLMPTILDLGDIDIPSSVAGKSLAPVLRGEFADHKDAVFSAVNLEDNLLRCVRTRTHRLSYGYQTDSGVTGEFFDLTNDPAEQFNRYSDQAYVPVRQELFQVVSLKFHPNR